MRLQLTCHYISPSFSKPGTAKVYINALENRIADLEVSLSKYGHNGAEHDHWASPVWVTDESDALLSTVRDLSLDTGGSYVGNTSNITLARIIGSLVGTNSVLGGKETTMSERQSFGEWDSHEDPSTSTAPSAPSERPYNSPVESDSAYSLMIHPEIAEKLIHAYILRFAGSFPVLHTAHLKDLYRRRADLESPYERGILHLVFALGGRFLFETVSFTNTILGTSFRVFVTYSLTIC
jgi:hypothetical protein